MNDALISGLLGAIMGGSSSIEKSIAEEEAAKRKEEEEKRREERALTLAERKADAEQKRKQILEEQERAKIAKTAPAKAPETGIVGNAIDEYQGEIANTGYTGQTRQATPEEALRWSIGKAREEGREDLAKQREEALYKMLKEGREAAKEAREQEEFARGPKPKEPTGDVAFAKYAAEKTYTGPRDASGKPDPTAFAEHEAKVIGQFVEKKTYIRPAGGAGEKPPTPSQIATADRAISRALPSLAKTKDISGKDVVDQQMLSYYRSAVNEIKKSDPNAVFDINGTLETAQAKVSAAEERAKQKAASEWRAMSDADKKASGITSERAYVRKNYKSYISNYLGGAAEEERPDPLGLRTR